MKDNTIIVLVAEGILGFLAILVPDPLIRGTAVGAMVGILGGHLNGAQGTTPASQ